MKRGVGERPQNQGASYCGDQNYTEEMPERRLVVMSCGPLHNVFRFIFPLVIAEEELTRGFDILEEVKREVNATI